MTHSSQAGLASLRGGQIRQEHCLSTTHHEPHPWTIYRPTVRYVLCPGFWAADEIEVSS